DPEGWVNLADSENWEFEIRPCAEVTFMNLLSKNRDSLIPVLISLVDRVADVKDYQALLFKDSVYTAIGLGVNSIYGRFDFESFVINRLQLEAKQKDASFKVLRRRIAWLLGKWITESISSDCRKVVYEVLIDLMGENEDLVVRLTAAQALKSAMEDWDFDIQIILPYLGTAVHSLLNILHIAEDLDITKKLISYLSAIIDRAGPEVFPYAELILHRLSSLWNLETEPLLQSSLVVTYTKLVGESHVYLLEDSLDLWWTLLQCTPTPTSQMMSLLPAALEFLDHDTENLRKVLKIIDSYIMLDPSSTMFFSLTLFTKLSYKVCQSREQAAAYIVHTLDLAFQSVPLEIYREALIESKLLNNIVLLLQNGNIYGYAIMNYMNLLSRLAIYDNIFVLSAIESMNSQQPEQFLSCVLDAWFDKVCKKPKY
ncbi:armadillo-type protein, partial [Sporodiniella umbellata]